ncbi:hypothetical protein AGMMS4956_20820 [Bacteroidia bacterium]|nr:hypothetical protein AGMMS4956_20820 [Bacteroidia bacterium]
MKKAETIKRQSAKAVAQKTTAVSKAENMLLNAIIVKEGTDKDSPFYKKPITTSLLVAKKFGKEHKVVLRAIKEILTSVQSCTDLSDGNLTSAQNCADLSKMFEAVKLPDNYGRMQPAYIMNKDGFTLLAMSFIGKQALQFKLDYIAEFNRRGGLILALEQQLIIDTLEKNMLMLERFSAENKQLKEEKEECVEYISHMANIPRSFAVAKQNFKDLYEGKRNEDLILFLQEMYQSITPEVLAYEDKVYKQKFLNE